MLAALLRMILIADSGFCRDELLEGEQLSTLHEAQMLIVRWRRHYNSTRPHSALVCRRPAPETTLPTASALPTLSFGQPRHWTIAT